MNITVSININDHLPLVRIISCFFTSNCSWTCSNSNWKFQKQRSSNRKTQGKPSTHAGSSNGLESPTLQLLSVFLQHCGTAFQTRPGGRNNIPAWAGYMPPGFPNQPVNLWITDGSSQPRDRCCGGALRSHYGGNIHDLCDVFGLFGVEPVWGKHGETSMILYVSLCDVYAVYVSFFLCPKTKTLFGATRNSIVNVGLLHGTWRNPWPQGPWPRNA